MRAARKAREGWRRSVGCRNPQCHGPRDRRGSSFPKSRKNPPRWQKISATSCSFSRTARISTTRACANCSRKWPTIRLPWPCAAQSDDLRDKFPQHVGARAGNMIYEETGIHGADKDFRCGSGPAEHSKDIRQVQRPKQRSSSQPRRWRYLCVDDLPGARRASGSRTGKLSGKNYGGGTKHEKVGHHFHAGEREASVEQL